MDNVSSIAELLAISWTYVSKLLSFVNIRNEGYTIIKRRWGKPVKAVSYTHLTLPTKA